MPNPIMRAIGAVKNFFMPQRPKHQKQSTAPPEVATAATPLMKPAANRHFGYGSRCSDGSVQTRTLASWRTNDQGHRFPSGSRRQQVASDHDVRCWDIMNTLPVNGRNAGFSVPDILMLLIMAIVVGAVLTKLVMAIWP